MSSAKRRAAPALRATGQEMVTCNWPGYSEDVAVEGVRLGIGEAGPSDDSQTAAVVGEASVGWSDIGVTMRPTVCHSLACSTTNYNAFGWLKISGPHTLVWSRNR